MIESREQGGSGAVPSVLSEPMEALVLEVSADNAASADSGVPYSQSGRPHYTEPVSACFQDSKSVAFMISSVHGKIVYVTKTVENVLGHSQVSYPGF